MRNKFLAGIIFKHDLYFISEVDRIMMKLNINSGKIECIDNPVGVEQPVSNSSIWGLPDRMIVYEKKIYVLETDGKRLVEYFVDENRYRYMEINCSVFECCNFAAFAIHKEKAYIFPSFLDKIITVDLKTGRVIQELKIKSDIPYVFDKTKRIPPKFFSCGCRVDNHEWVFMERLGEVIEYDMETEDYYRHTIPAGIKGCVHAEWKYGVFYILSLEGKVYEWNFRTNSVREWNLGNEAKPYPTYREMVVANKIIWILPEIGEDILVIDIEKNKVKKYLNYPMDFSYEAPKQYSKYYRHCEDENYYYFSMHSGNYIFCVEKQSGKEKWIKPIEPEEADYMEYYVRNGWYLNEKEYTLGNYIQSMKVKYQSLQKDQFSIGSVIWRKAEKL